MGSKFKEFFLKYGPIAVGTQIGICGLWFGCTYTAVKSGFNYKKYLETLGIDPENEKIKMSSDVVISYVLYKAMTPVRVPITIAAIPIVAKILRYTPKA